jgi:glutamate racemase
MSSTSPIGIFDSGLGGLTVMKEIRRLCPREDLLYFGDTARVPYGNRSPEAIKRFSLESSHFFLQREIKLLVVACNTVASWALPEMTKLAPFLPIIDVVTAGAKAATSTLKDPSIALLATRATVTSKSYHKAISDLSPNARLHAIACPLFVPLVEEGFIDHPATRIIIREYLSQIDHQTIDLWLLGCTHYPPLKPQLEQILGSHCTIIDSATSCAEEVRRYLYSTNMANIQSRGEDLFFVSDDPEKFGKLGPHFYGSSVDNVKHQILEERDALC